MDAPTAIVLLIIVMAMIFAIRHIIKRRKNGCGCGCGCGSCSSKCSCFSPDEKQKKSE